MRPRIMVVDDERGVREVLRLVLESMGWEVETHPDGASALAAWVPARFDALSTDFEMGKGMSGVALAVAVREMDASSKVFMFSGTPEAKVSAELAGAEFFHKDSPSTYKLALQTFKAALPEYCDCADCSANEEPCALDCVPDGDECAGCRDARLDREDAEFEIDRAQGRIK